MPGYIVFTSDGEVTETRKIMDENLRVIGTYAVSKETLKWFYRSTAHIWDAIDTQDVPDKHKALLLLMT